MTTAGAAHWGTAGGSAPGYRVCEVHPALVVAGTPRGVAETWLAVAPVGTGRPECVPRANSRSLQINRGCHNEGRHAPLSAGLRRLRRRLRTHLHPLPRPAGGAFQGLMLYSTPSAMPERGGGRSGAAVGRRRGGRRCATAVRPLAWLPSCLESNSFPIYSLPAVPCLPALVCRRVPAPTTISRPVGTGKLR